MKTRILIAAVLFFCSVITATGQTIINVSGKVVDSQSQPISNVKVTLEGRAMSVYTDSQGDFIIYHDATGIEFFKESREVYYNGDAVYLLCKNQNIIITLYNLSGQKIMQYDVPRNYSGTYKFYPSTFFPATNQVEIYILTINTGGQFYSYKVLNTDNRNHAKGIVPADITGIGQNQNSGLQKGGLKAGETGLVGVDKLIFEHSSFKTKEVELSSYVQSVGNVILEVIPLFEGFDNITFSVGDYWEYSWTYNQTVNGSKKPTKSGIVRIELIDKVTNTFNVIGSLDLYETSYFNKSGDDYPLTWNSIKYFAFKESVFYGASSTSGVAILFDFNKGTIYKSGFIGYFSSNREESIYESGGLVVVSEPFYDPECETIAGVRICDDEYHDYKVQEYYKAGKGFYGFYRSGTSIFSGGGYVDMFQSTMEVELSSTSLK